MKTSFISIIALALILALSPATTRAGLPWAQPYIEFLHTGALQVNEPHGWQLSFTTGNLNLVLLPGQRIVCNVASLDHSACRGAVYNGHILPTIVFQSMYDGLACDGGLTVTESTVVTPNPLSRCTFVPLIAR